jgi:hypothetical protein
MAKIDQREEITGGGLGPPQIKEWTMSTATRLVKTAGPEPLRAKLAAEVPELETESVVTRDGTYIEPEDRLDMIAEAAYYRAEKRGFEPGHEVQDWLEAEMAVDATIKRGDQPHFPGRP